MQIETVSFKFGMTQNLGDYTNTRPEIELVAELDEDDDIEETLDELSGIALFHIHNLVDDELEQAGREVKYTDEPLYQVRYSKLRQCIVIALAGLKLPEESTWKESDQWHRPGDVYPSRVRRKTAEKQANRLMAETGYQIVLATHPAQFLMLPALPDPGSEPQWHTKGLKQRFEYLHLGDKAIWEELAGLEHVTADYLRELYNKDAERRLSSAELVELIRTNAPWPPQDEKVGYEAGDVDDYDEEEWDDDED